MARIPDEQQEIIHTPMQIEIKRCALCTVSLSSKFGSKRRTKYCDTCVEGYGQKLYNLYHLRAYRKRNGLEQPKIEEKIILSYKRPRMTQKRIEEYKKARLEGYSYADIARSHKITKQAVYKVLKPLLTNKEIVS